MRLQKTRSKILQFFSSRPKQADKLEPQAVLSLVIEGVEVFAVETVPTGAVRFCAPGHPLNPTESNIIVCDLATFVSLAANVDSQRLVAMMVREALRALRVKARAAERRGRRSAKRTPQVSPQL
jgi:hypothetical protein